MAEMEIAVYSDNKIEDRDALSDYFRAAVERELRPVGGDITGVEVHLGDENGSQWIGDDKRCVMVVQLDGHQPMSVTHHGTTFGAAMEGACDRLNRMIGKALGCLREPHHRSNPFVSEPA
ncbi:MAG: ribosomal subunit interface protein [Fibrobacteria bacterium]